MITEICMYVCLCYLNRQIRLFLIKKTLECSMNTMKNCRKGRATVQLIGGLHQLKQGSIILVS